MTTLSPRGLPLPSLQGVLVALALGILAGPTLHTLSRTVWTSNEQSHGPLILAASAWLVFSSRRALSALPPAGSVWPGWTVLALGLPAWALAQSQSLLTLEVAALVAIVCGVVLVFKGRAGLTLLAFPLAFLLFCVPWPETLVVTLTQPLKAAVSAVSETLLHTAGYPVGRSGVMMTVGPYEVLVADACAGLNSMFVLEAITLLYIKLFGSGDRVREVTLAMVAIPIAFAANVVRVLVLVLLLLHFGDGVAQDFIHSFAGLLLMGVALLLTFAADSLIRAVLSWWRARRVTARP